VLKLLTRLYDPTEGQIFVDGRDIKSLRVDDLRETVAVLFQDYTLFPLSVRREYPVRFQFSFLDRFARTSHSAIHTWHMMKSGSTMPSGSQGLISRRNFQMGLTAI